ncbi:hypothetical protein ACOMHN_016679 [Nucella lapillus]
MYYISQPGLFQLRRMEHRLGDPGLAAGFESGGSRVPYGSSGGPGLEDLNPGSGPSTTTAALTARDTTYSLDPHRQPTARFVEAARPSSSPSRLAAAGAGRGGTKRKVTRVDDKDSTPRPSSSSKSVRHHRRGTQPTRTPGAPQAYQAWLDPGEAAATAPPSSSHYYQQQYPQQQQQQRLRNKAATSPKRVDFSKRLRLREVCWDGTYQDTVAHKPQASAQSLGYPSHPSFASTTTTNNTTTTTTFASSSSSSAVADRADSQSTLTDSRALRETEIHFLNDTYATEAIQSRQPHLDAHPSSSQQRPRHPRLTHVDFDLPRSRSGSPLQEVPFSSRGAGHAEVGRESRTRPYGVSGSGDVVMSGGGGGGGFGGDMGDYSSSGDSERGAAGGVERPSRSDGGGGGSNSRIQKIKKSLKDLPGDDNILTKLREKIKQQRLGASSTGRTMTCYDRGLKLDCSKYREDMTCYDRGLKLDCSKYREDVTCYDRGLKLDCSKYREDMTCYDRGLKLDCSKYREDMTCYDRGLKLDCSKYREDMTCYDRGLKLDCSKYREDMTCYDRGLKLDCSKYREDMTCYDRGLKLDCSKYREDMTCYDRGLKLDCSKYRENVTCCDRGLKLDCSKYREDMLLQTA